MHSYSFDLIKVGYAIKTLIIEAATIGQAMLLIDFQYPDWQILKFDIK